MLVSVGIVGTAAIAGIVCVSSQPDSPAGPHGVWFVRGGAFRNPPEAAPKPCPQWALQQAPEKHMQTDAPCLSLYTFGIYLALNLTQFHFQLAPVGDCVMMNLHILVGIF